MSKKMEAVGEVSQFGDWYASKEVPRSDPTGDPQWRVRRIRHNDNIMMLMGEDDLFDLYELVNALCEEAEGES